MNLWNLDLINDSKSIISMQEEDKSAFGFKHLQSESINHILYIYIITTRLAKLESIYVPSASPHLTVQVM